MSNGSKTTRDHDPLFRKSSGHLTRFRRALPMEQTRLEQNQVLRLTILALPLLPIISLRGTLPSLNTTLRYTTTLPRSGLLPTP